MFGKIKESKYTYLAIGILVGFALTYAYTKFKKE